MICKEILIFNNQDFFFICFLDENESICIKTKVDNLRLKYNYRVYVYKIVISLEREV